jgi:hypothetical protein
MRPSKIRVTGIGVSPWFPLDYMQPTFKVSTLAEISSGATVSYGMQAAYELPSDDWKQIEATRSTTSLTVNFIGVSHGASVGDTVTLKGTPWDGTYPVATVTYADTVVLTVADTGAAAGFGFGGVMRAQSVYTGKTAAFEQTFISPVRAIRLNVTASDGFVELLVLQGQNR